MLVTCTGCGRTLHEIGNCPSCGYRTRPATDDEAAEFYGHARESEQLREKFEAGLEMPIGAGAALVAEIDAELARLGD